MKVRETCTTHLNSSGKALQSANQLRVARLRVEDHVLRDRLKSARTAAPPVDLSTTAPPELPYRRGCRVPQPWAACAKSAAQKLSPTSTTGLETHANAIVLQAPCGVNCDVVHAVRQAEADV